jgi:putative ABC transport system permease protein
VIELLRLVSVPQLRASWARTLLVIAGTLTGVALIVAINVINTSISASFRQTLTLIAGPADLEVTLGIGEIGFPEATLETVRGTPGVQTAVPLLRGTISLADHPTETLQLFGADLAAEADLGRYQIATTTERREALKAIEDTRGIFLTEEFAANHAVSVGDGLRLSTPRGVDAFVVRGLLRPEGLARAFGGELAVMDLPTAQQWLGKEGRIDQIDVVVASDTPASVVAARLAATLPATLNVAPPQQRTLKYDAILASFQAMLTGLSLLCLVAGIFIIYNTTATGALHRAVLMAGLRRIGATPRQVFSLFMMEAFLLGAIGTALGIGVGIVLARLLTGMVTASMGVIFQLRFPADAQAIDSSQIAVIALVGIGATLFASAFTAFQVARLDPLEVLRKRARRPLGGASPRQLVLAWIALVLISAGALVLEREFKSIAWGNFGATLWNGSVIVIAIPLVSWVARTFSAVLSRMFGAEGEVAATSLFRAPTRTGVTVAAVALVLTVGITVASLAYSFHRTTATYVEGFLAGDLIVSAVATEGGWLEAPVPAALMDELGAVSGVARVDRDRGFDRCLLRSRTLPIGLVS